MRAGEEIQDAGGVDYDDQNVWGPYEDDGEEAAAAELEDLDGVSVVWCMLGCQHSKQRLERLESAKRAKVQ